LSFFSACVADSNILFPFLLFIIPLSHIIIGKASVNFTYYEKKKKSRTDDQSSGPVTVMKFKSFITHWFEPHQ